jgi:hypothetical protein
MKAMLKQPKRRREEATGKEEGRTNKTNNNMLQINNCVE